MTEPNSNIIYELLTNASVPAKIVDSIKTDNFWIKEFLTDSAVINGDSAEYYSSNPAVGTNYKKGDMKFEEDVVFKVIIPVLINKLYQCTITKDQLRIATGDTSKAEMIAALQANYLKKKYDLDIMEECTKAVCKETNFTSGKNLIKLTGTPSVEDFLFNLFDLAERMKLATKDFNKGFKKKDNTYQPITFAGESLKHMVIVLNTAWKTKLRLEGSKTFNYNLVNLKEEFKNVYDCDMPDDFAGLILHEESFALNWQIEPKLIVQDHHNDPLSQKVSFPGFLVGGLITFANVAAIIAKAPRQQSTAAASTLGGSGS